MIPDFLLSFVESVLSEMGIYEGHPLISGRREDFHVVVYSVSWRELQAMSEAFHDSVSRLNVRNFGQNR